MKAALFDLDGTLFDTESQYSVYWGAVGRQYHPDIAHFEQIIKGATLSAILGRYFPHPDEAAAIEQGLKEWEQRMEYRFFDGALELLADLRSHGVKTAVVTSSNQKKMASVRAQLPNFDSLFDVVLTAEDFAASKPDPDCYLRAAQHFALPVEECVVFEDALNGIQAGMAAGMYTFGMATTNPRELIAPHCSKVLDSFEGVDYDTLCHLIQKR